MQKFFPTVFTMICSMFLVAGCHSIGTEGRKLAEQSTPFKKVHVFADDEDRFTDKKFPEIKVPQAIIVKQKELLTLLETRLPLVFSLNGIEASVELKSKENSSSLEMRSAAPYYMTLIPAKGTFGPSTGTSILFNASIRDNTTKKFIWAGQIFFLDRNNPSLQFSAADDFSASLLSQLHENGIIKLSDGKPKTP